jgi:hypothetical protein
VLCFCSEDVHHLCQRQRDHGKIDALPVFMVALENYLTTIGQWVFVVQGVIFVVCVLLLLRDPSWSTSLDHLVGAGE